MKQNYYMIVQNTLEVIDIGEYASLIDAEKSLAAAAEHYSHGEPFILVPKDGMIKLRNATFYLDGE